MPKHLEHDLNQLQRDLLTLAAAVEEAVHKAVRALRLRGAALAREVLAGDDQIDAEENQIQEECLRVLALHQPVARDLRQVTAVMSITTDLERIGDLAGSMAERALALTRLTAVRVPPRLEKMADQAVALVRQSLDAFANLDVHSARTVCRLDDQVDQLNAEIIGELIRTMKECPDTVEANLSLFSAVRQLERIADHATNIAEDVIYLVEGEIVRHHPEAIRSEKQPDLPALVGFPAGTGGAPAGIPVRAVS
jgi:phosphate transport system protein